MAEENAKVHSLSVKDTGNLALKELEARFHFQRMPQSIGAFDVSNIAGKEAVGAFVYWENGEFKKQHYRHIKMDAVRGPDDYAMMKEMVKRTISSLEGDLPDLIIIDGGREHLEAALSVFRENHIRDRISSVLPKTRTDFLEEKVPVGLEDGKPSSLLLRRSGTRSTRFAISYHRNSVPGNPGVPSRKDLRVGRKRRLHY
jgi:excinuclease ABC subunit C